MRVRDWADIMNDVAESSADPDGWRAVGGGRDGGVGEDLYVGHPSVGVYHLKTYARNPFDVQGVGTRVARRVDDDLDPLFPDDSAGRFAVQTPPEDEAEAESMAREVEETIRVHGEAPTSPEDLFRDLMDAIDSPAFGPMEYDRVDRPEALDDLADEFADAEALLGSELDDLVDEADVGRGLH